MKQCSKTSIYKKSAIKSEYVILMIQKIYISGRGFQLVLF